MRGNIGSSETIETIAPAPSLFSFPVGIPLQIEIEGVSLKMSSTSVGYVGERCLIIRYPETGAFGNISSKLFKGNLITVRYVTGGDVIGFQSQLIGMTTEPIRLIFITFPIAMARHNLRSSKRIACYLPAEIVVNQTRSAVNRVTGVVTDISRSGCSFSFAKKQLADGSRLEARVEDGVSIRLELPGNEGTIEMDGDIRRTERDSDHTSFGVSFKGNDGIAKRRMDEYLSRLEESGLGPQVSR